MSLGSPANYIPGELCHTSIIALLESIGLPKPNEIVQPHVTAAYHAIYFLSFPLLADHKDEKLVLRVSGPHLPKIKTENEAAVMSWVAKNTTIPIPRVTQYDSSTKNPLGHEYILLSCASGQSISDIYESLTEEQVSAITDQLIDVLVQLHAHEWSAIGGLHFDDAGNVGLGPVLEETFWQVPDIAKYWPAGETVDTLNINGLFKTYVEYISAHVRKYIHMITIHEKLGFMHEHLARLEAFLEALNRDAEELNRVQIRLAHKVLHFANIMYDVEAGQIISILDWEFSGIVPFTRWGIRAGLFRGTARTMMTLFPRSNVYTRSSLSAAKQGK